MFAAGIIASAIALLAPSSSRLGWARDFLPQSSSSSTHHARAKDHPSSISLDPGSVSDGAYRNKSLAFTCKIPAGWVLRTDELNARDDEDTKPGKPAPDSANTDRVLLAAFARPPQARGEDINSSIVIAAESASAYPGLKDAAQYLGAVGEVAKAQGFTMNDDPYEVELGTKTVVRADFQKDVGSRVMRQSTLVILARGYAVSFTFIGGTEDEVDELIDGLSFAGAVKPPHH